MILRLLDSHTSLQLEQLKHDLEIEDNGSKHKKYIQIHMTAAWKALRAVQSDDKNIREAHMEILVDYYANKRNSSQGTEIKNSTIREN